MKISVIVPVYNEEKFVKKLLISLYKTNFNMSKEIVIINDGSKDGSKKEIVSFMKGKKDIIFIDKENGGKGSAIIEGIKKSTGDIIAIQDADLEYPPSELARIVKMMVEKNLDAIYGNRFKLNNNWTHKTHYVGNRVLSFLFSLFYFRFVEDMETCYKIVKSKYLKEFDLQSNDFRIEVEITAKLVRGGLKFKEVPIKYLSRSYDEGKKIGWKDGIKAIIAIMKFRFQK